MFGFYSKNTWKTYRTLQSRTKSAPPANSPRAPDSPVIAISFHLGEGRCLLPTSRGAPCALRFCVGTDLCSARRVEKPPSPAKIPTLGLQYR